MTELTRLRIAAETAMQVNGSDATIKLSTLVRMIDKLENR